MGRLSRTKGAAFERTIATALSAIWPGAKRGLVQCRSGDEVADVEGTPYWVECKHQKSVSIRAAIKQAALASDGRPLLIVTRRDREDTLVTMRIRDWIELAQRAEGKVRI